MNEDTDMEHDIIQGYDMVTAIQMAEAQNNLREVRFVNVKFNEGGRGYTYKTNILNITVGDTVVVPSSFSKKEKQKYVTATVVDDGKETPIMPEPDIRYKWIVCRVDTDSYEKLREADVELNQQIAQRALYKKAQELMEELPAGSGSKFRTIIRNQYPYPSRSVSVFPATELSQDKDEDIKHPQKPEPKDDDYRSS